MESCEKRIPDCDDATVKLWTLDGMQCEQTEC